MNVVCFVAVIGTYILELLKGIFVWECFAESVWHIWAGKNGTQGSYADYLQLQKSKAHKAVVKFRDESPNNINNNAIALPPNNINNNEIALPPNNNNNNSITAPPNINDNNAIGGNDNTLQVAIGRGTSRKRRMSAAATSAVESFKTLVFWTEYIQEIEDTLIAEPIRCKSIIKEVVDNAEFKASDYAAQISHEIVTGHYRPKKKMKYLHTVKNEMKCEHIKKEMMIKQKKKNKNKTHNDSLQTVDLLSSGDDEEKEKTED